jgi:hypothetical protein
MHPKQRQEIEKLRIQSAEIAAGSLLPEVVALMRQRVPDLGDRLFLFSDIPDQGEDIYTFVTSNRLVVSVEVPRQGGDYPGLEIKPLEAFWREPHAKGSNRKLDAIQVILSDQSADT